MPILAQGCMVLIVPKVNIRRGFTRAIIDRKGAFGAWKVLVMLTGALTVIGRVHLSTTFSVGIQLHTGIINDGLRIIDSLAWIAFAPTSGWRGPVALNSASGLQLQYLISFIVDLRMPKSLLLVLLLYLGELLFKYNKLSSLLIQSLASIGFSCFLVTTTNASTLLV